MDEIGHWVKFIVLRTEVTPSRPHGLSYSLTLHAPDGTRLVGFDNAHPVRERRGPGTWKRSESDHSRLCQNANFGVRTAPPSFPRKRESRGGGGALQQRFPPPPHLDSRFRGNDDFGGRCLSRIEF